MSRHRNIRSMNYQDECEGFDDIYGHSVEDGDFCVSPGTAAQFTFDRSRHDPLAMYVSSPSNAPIAEETIEDEYEDFDDAGPHSLSDSSSGLRQRLNSLERAKLNSCIEAMQSIMGESTPESVMVSAALKSDFDPNAAVDMIMSHQESPKQQRQPRDRRQRFTRPTADVTSQSNIANVKVTTESSSATPQGGSKSVQLTSKKPLSLVMPKGDSSGASVAAAKAANTGATWAASKGDIGALGSTSKGDAVVAGTAASKGGEKTSEASSKKRVPPGFAPKEVPEDAPPKILYSRDAYADRDAEARNEYEDVGAERTPLKDACVPEVQALKREDNTPAAGGLHKSASKAKMDRLDVQKEYDKRKAGGKDYISLVVIGHVDAGKSTLMGHLLYQLGFVNKRTMHKYEQDSKKIGKGSFAYAWVLDETEEERCRGVTMDVAQTTFETTTKVVTLLDAPGHKDFIPNMITGAAQADVAVLVINSTKGEFETGFEAGGQTREHAMLVRSLGVSQLLVAVNKMDTVDWSKERYDAVVEKLGLFLAKNAGFKDTDVSFIPCSGLQGDNLTKPSPDKQLNSWYKGPTLVEQIDKFRPPDRPIIDKPFRMCVTDVFKGMGAGFSVGGTIQAGSIQAGDKVTVIPAGETSLVKNMTIDESAVGIAFAGDNVVLTLTGIDIINISIGSFLCDPTNVIEPTTKFRARIVIFNIDVPITQGFPVVLHYQSVTEQAHIKRLISQLHKNTGEVIKKKPRCLVKNTNAIVDIQLDRPICLELYSEFKELGRFMLRSAGSTIAAGIVTEIHRQKVEANGTSA